ncbi:uncharacterized protein CCDC197 [Rhinatrema bivittatum]|uniref:uncharacterized protein CCDC197 n=1 Tax=Rhinatrema bivittatum TaxID=194408 RepID=UPI00112C24E6|nr:uncharacterized protein CCDC197 [Rhinatrema bivittatum]
MSGGDALGLGYSDSRYCLQIKNPKRNVFVTQLEEGRDEEEGDVTRIPIIRETASKILETGANTLQHTLVLKKQVEFDHVSAQLVAKRQEFTERMGALERKRAEFLKCQEEYKERALKFDKFLKDNDAKRRRALQKHQSEVKQNQSKQEEINGLIQQLEELKVRQKKLQKMIAKYKIYEDYLLNVVDNVPENYLEYGVDSPAKAIIRKHEALSATNKTLLDHLLSLTEDCEKTQHKLEGLHHEHETTKLMMTSEVSQLQMKHDKLQERNKHLELNINLQRSHFRHQSVELGRVLMSIANLAEQCHMPHYGPLQQIELLPKLDMIKEFILERMNVEQLTSQLVKARLSIAGDKPQSKNIGPSKQKLKGKVAAVGSNSIIQTQLNNSQKISNLKR